MMETNMLTHTGSITAAVVLALSAAVASAAPLPVAQYSFDNTLAADDAGDPALIAVDPTGQNGFLNAPVPTDFAADPQPTDNRQVYIFDSAGSNAGLILPDAGDLVSDDDTYTIELIFEIENVNGFRKLIDFESRNNDSGVYVSSGQQSLYSDVASGNTPLRPGGSATADVFTQLFVTVDDGVVTLYQDGASLVFLDQTESDDNFILPDGQDLTFFLDDGNGGEFSSGSVAKIALYDAALTAQDVAELAASPFTPIPEPTSVAALAGLGLLSLRRRR